MLKVKNHENTSRLLNEDTAVEWYEITGKELMIQVHQKESVLRVTLDMKQEGRKTPKTVLVLATVVIPETATAKYETEPNLEDTLYAFATENYLETIVTVSRLLTTAMEGNRVVDLTGIPSRNIDFAVRVERDADDEIIAEDVVATIGNAVAPTHIYSNAGVFDSL